MKLAEALMERADAQTKLAQLNGRIVNNLIYQDGEEPAENPVDLLAEYESAADRLLYLVQQINETNAGTRVIGGPVTDGLHTLTDALARRDDLSRRSKVYASVASHGASRITRYSRSEIKLVSAVNVRDMQEKADSLALQYRELDAIIQAANWNTDLVE